MYLCIELWMNKTEHSTELAVTELTDRILININNKNLLLAIFMDLKRLMIVSRLYYISIQKYVMPSVHYSDVNMNICIYTE